MKKRVIVWAILWALLVTLTVSQALRAIDAERQIIMLKEQNQQLHQSQQEQYIVIDKPYTMITNLSSTMYINSVTISSDALHWTNVNGVSGFDVTVGTTHYRYVEGHIEGKQLSLYAPYLYIEENIFE